MKICDNCGEPLWRDSYIDYDDFPSYIEYPDSNGVILMVCSYCQDDEAPTISELANEQTRANLSATGNDDDGLNDDIPF